MLKRSRGEVWKGAPDTGFFDGLVRRFLARRDRARQQRLMASDIEQGMQDYRAKLDARVQRGEISRGTARRYLDAERRLARRQHGLRLAE